MGIPRRFVPADNTPKKLSDKFPRGRITKQSGQKVLMGRSKELDILLNDEHMPRTFMELWCENVPRDSATEEAGAQSGPKWPGAWVCMVMGDQDVNLEKMMNDNPKNMMTSSEVC
nr:hypothetical protein BaRGS_029680 [Batillaria attramentaria]